jgi:uncharacterized DUF497 family protein
MHQPEARAGLFGFLTDAFVCGDPGPRRLPILPLLDHELTRRNSKVPTGERPGATIWSVPTVSFGDFEWDAEKAATNVTKHGVTFEEAVTVFLDLDYLLVRDAASAERFVAIGMSKLARVLFVVHCERREKLRIVSARRATRREREAYERRREPD